MARSIPEGRIGDLAAAAVRVFIRQGYKRTQVADVAAELGVAKGTIYLYVASKEALFDLAVCHVVGALPAEATLPLPPPAPGATLEIVRAHIAAQADLPLLQAALRRRRVIDTGREIEGILGELYDVQLRNRVAMKLIDRCAMDQPQLAVLWSDLSRDRVPQLLEHYLEGLRGRRLLAAPGDLKVLARMTMETLTFWAVHRFWDPFPQELEEEAVRATVLSFLRTALLGKESP